MCVLSCCCIIVDHAKCFFEISIFLDVLKCLIKVEVVKRHVSKYLVKIHMKCYYFGAWPNHLLEQYTVYLCTGSREEGGGSTKSSMPVCF